MIVHKDGVERIHSDFQKQTPNGGLEYGCTITHEELIGVNPWKIAIEGTLHGSNLDCPDDPYKALSKLIWYETEIALDPAVSQEARKLIEQGRAEAQKEIDKLRLVISSMAEHIFDKWEAQK